MDKLKILLVIVIASFVSLIQDICLLLSPWRVNDKFQHSFTWLDRLSGWLRFKSVDLMFKYRNKK